MLAAAAMGGLARRFRRHGWPAHRNVAGLIPPAKHDAERVLSAAERAAAPLLWLLTATVEVAGGGASCRLDMQLHAVRGLAAIVMSAGYGGSLSSTSGGSSSTHSAAVLWGRHTWELPLVGGGGAAAAAAATAAAERFLHSLHCWACDEVGFPLLHAFAAGGHSSASGGGAGGGGGMLLAGRTLATVQDGAAAGMQVRGRSRVVDYVVALMHLHCLRLPLR